MGLLESGWGKLARLVAGSLSAVSEAPTSEDLSFRCAVKGRFRYSTKTCRYLSALLERAGIFSTSGQMLREQSAEQVSEVPLASRALSSVIFQQLPEPSA